MNVKLIGTGAIWTACGSASAMIDENIIIDLPGGTMKTLLRTGVDHSKITHVLLTHMHGDHILDLPVWALSKVKFGNPEQKLCIYTEAVNEEPLRQLMEFSFSHSLRREVNEQLFDFITDDAFSIGSYRFERVRVQHGSIDAFGYVIREGEKTVSFTGDTCMCDAVERMAADSQLLFCDVSLLKGNNKHMGVNDALMLAEKYPDCTVIATHMKDEARDALENQEADNLFAAYDGMILNI